MITRVLQLLDYLHLKVFYFSWKRVCLRFLAQKKGASKRPSPALQVLPTPDQPTYEPIDLANVPPPMQPILDRDYVAAENLDFEHTAPDEIRHSLGVASYPTTDLTKEMPGIPPTEDFSKVKPQNQVTHDTFLKYIEPYFRPFTEDDLTFLRQQVPFLHLRADWLGR